MFSISAPHRRDPTAPVVRCVAQLSQRLRGGARAAGSVHLTGACEHSMSYRSVRGALTLLVTLAVVAPASAQYPSLRSASQAPGEDYTVEFAALYWNPTPDFILRTESLNILGTTIDLADDLNIEQKRLPDFRFVLKAGRRHKLRVSYLPITYTSEAVLDRTIVFNGTTYRIGLPVNADFEWKAWRFGYEFDFIVRDRGYVGFIVEAKYTDVSLSLASPALSETASAQVPVPAVGGTFRVYPAPFLAITGEVSGIKLPGSLTDGEDTADYIDWDLYATANFTRNIGAQVGYRTLDISYRYDDEFGDFKIKGPYFGAVVRF